jgi:uncharacterized membrane protein
MDLLVFSVGLFAEADPSTLTRGLGAIHAVTFGRFVSACTYERQLATLLDEGTKQIGSLPFSLALLVLIERAAGSVCLARKMRDFAVSLNLGIPAIIGVSTATLVGTTAGWQYAIAAGWIATAVVYLVWTWARIARTSAAAIERLVHHRSLSLRIADGVVVIASVASLSGVGYLLAAGTVKGPDKTIAAAIGFSSVIASWLVVHTIFTLRHAVHYYTEPVGGIHFNQEDDRPAIADFAYLAFTVAATYGVTDTPLQTRPIRVTALQQAMGVVPLRNGDPGPDRTGHRQPQQSVAVRPGTRERFSSHLWPLGTRRLTGRGRAYQHPRRRPTG